MKERTKKRERQTEEPVERRETEEENRHAHSGDMQQGCRHTQMTGKRGR
jgi:hypothetical protein